MGNGNGRRSSDDPKWVETKKIVDKRDKRQCQFERCLTAKESYQLEKGSPVTLDRAHILSAANYPDQIYNPKNVITLKRFIHRRMDDYQCPLTGSPVNKNLHFFWWYRILKKSTELYNDNTDYELELLVAIR